MAAAREAPTNELAQMQAKIEKISVPLSHTDELPASRSNIELVRQRMAKA